jgi:hypothetical protein
LRGRFYWNTFTRRWLCEGNRLLSPGDRALIQNYALAYAGIAAYYNWLGSFTVCLSRNARRPPTKLRRLRSPWIPTLAEGYAALGQAIICRDFAWSNAERQLLHAIELDPNYSPARESTTLYS